MAQDNSLNKTTEMNQRRSRTKFTENQLKILIKAFNQKPYPGYATKQKLALEINTEESRIQIWFQNRRARHRVQKISEPEEGLEASQDQDYHGQKIHSREDRRCRTNYTSSQLHTLITAFMKNPYPGIDSREQLAKEIGIPESRVQIWFQNRRSRFHVQRKRELEPLEQKQDQEQDSCDKGVQEQGGSRDNFGVLDVISLSSKSLSSWGHTLLNITSASQESGPSGDVKQNLNK